MVPQMGRYPNFFAKSAAPRKICKISLSGSPKYFDMSRESAQFFFYQAGRVLFGKYVACRTRRQPNFIENTWAVVNHEMSCAIYEFLCLRPQTVFYKTLFIMKSLAENRPMFQSLLKTSLRFKLLSSLNVLRFVFIYV